MIDFSVVKTAGVPTAHFAKLCCASRVSATLWLKGAVQPCGLYAMRVKQVLEMLRKAVAANKLPLPPTPRLQRYKALVEAIRNN